MKDHLIESLCCPGCREQLEFTSVGGNDDECLQGIIECANGHLFPIVDGIPRFLPDSLAYYAASLDPLLPSGLRAKVRAQRGQTLPSEFAHTQQSFSSEWAAVEDTDHAWGQSVDERRRLFLKCLDVSFETLKGKRILDAGCGHGEVELGLLSSGAEIFAIDLSSSVDSIRRRLLPASLTEGTTVHLVQGNLHALPFKDAAFDYVHSAGVLHHTPSTLKGFAEISRTLKKGGRCFIEVYSTEHKNFVELAQYHTFRFLRTLTLRMSHSSLHRLCAAAAPFAWAYVKAHATLLRKQRYLGRSIHEMHLSLFDALSPLYDWHHSTDEVSAWFSQRGYRDLKKTYFNHNVIGIVGHLEPS